MSEGPWPLPEGWRWVRLGEVCTKPQYGFTARAVQDRVGPKFVRVSDIRSGFIAWEEVPYCQIDETSMQRYAVRVGDLLVARSGSVGSVAVVRDLPDCPAVFASYLLRLRCDAQTADPFYIYFFMRSPAGQRMLVPRGAAQPNINARRLEEFLLPLPPLDEQRRIVARIEELMERIREARRLREQARADADRLWQSVLADTFPRPGDDLPAGWRWVRLGEVCCLRNGRAYKKSDWSRNGYPIIRIQNLNNPSAPFNFWKGDLAGHVVVYPGDVLIAWSGTPGTSFGAHVWRRPEVGVLNQHIWKVEFKQNVYEKAFFVSAINRGIDIMISAAHGGVGLRHVTKREMQNLSLPLPPLDEQKRIVAHLDAVQERIRELRAAQDRTAEALETLERSILDRAFRGEL